jgi:exopolysaccharide biosynthesis WecB/TagA/CpsF family protein
MRENVTIQNVPIANLYEAEFFEIFQEYLEDHRQRTILFANAHSCNVAQKDVGFLIAVKEADLVLPDGIGLKIAGKVIGHSIKANLNGTDLLPKVLSVAAEKNLRIFFLGGEPGVAEKAKEQLINRIPQLRIVGVHHGYFTHEEQRNVIEEINRSEAELLLVGLGVPFQEKWIWQFRSEIGTKFLFGVGAFLDFSAGRFTRAPLMFRNFGIEWLFRLYQEPRRLFTRYVFGNITFLLRTFCSNIF